MIDLDPFYQRTGIEKADYSLIRKVPLFSGISEDSLPKLLMDATVRGYPRGTFLFFQGDTADCFYVAFDGWVKLFRQIADGHESVVHVMGRGDSFAEAAIFDSSVFPVSAEVVVDCRLLVIPAKDFIDKVVGNSDLALNIMAAMSRRNRHLVSVLEQMTVKSTPERLALFLSGLFSETEGAMEIDLPLDKNLIASRLGMQPETLSRSFAKLRAIGIETKGGRVTIPDVVALANYGKGDD